jgi:leucyl-tRNA synthetase
VEGAYRFVQRLWRLVSEAAPHLSGVPAKLAVENEAGAISKAAHKTLKLVGEDIEKLAFNKAVARIYELTNVLQGPLGSLSSGKAAPEVKSALREALEFLVVMIAPMMPHLAEECWAALDGKGFAANRPWPKFDPALTVDSEVIYPVQINGKKRGELTIARDTDEGAVRQAALALDFVLKALEGKPPRKVIVVPGRIVNVVA